MITTLTTFFSNLKPNERMLVLSAVGLCVLLGLWQFVIAPMNRAHDTALTQRQSAIRDLSIVQSGLPQLSRAVSPDKQTFDRSALIRVASQRNVQISRVQPMNGNDLKVWFENAQSAGLFALLTQVEGEYAVRLREAQIERRQDGGVSAQITFVPTSTGPGS